MKNFLLYGSFITMLVAGMTASGQEKSAAGAVVPASFLAQQGSYSPNEIQVVGTIDSGQTSNPEEYAHTSKYQAFVFEGNGHDRVEVTVTGAKAYVALADSTLTPIAGGVGRVYVALPYHGPDTEAFYILVKSLSSQPARLSVHLQKSPANPVHPADATR
jgi:hypothetical protein